MHACDDGAMATHLEQTIRAAHAGDAEAVAALLLELGYPTAVNDARERLVRARGRADGGVIVAEVQREVVGVAAYEIVPLLERARPQCRLTTLVVRSDQRRRGVAATLLAGVESAARAAACFRLEVTTQPTRSDALAFYAAAGFTERPHRLVKMLTA